MMAVCDRCDRCNKEARWGMKIVAKGGERTLTLCDRCREKVYKELRNGGEVVVEEQLLDDNELIYVYELLNGEQLKEEIWCKQCGRMLAEGNPMVWDWTWVDWHFDGKECEALKEET